MPKSDTLLVRSALFVPAIRERFIEKAPDAGADLVCLDLEDSVALAEKPKGREMARDAMPGMKRTGYLMAVRVNSLQSGLIEDDLDAVVIPDLQAIGLPKADDPEIIRRVDHYLTILEKTRGIPVGTGADIPVDRDGAGAYQRPCTVHGLGAGDSGISRGGRPDLRHGNGENDGRAGSWSTRGTWWRRPAPPRASCPWTPFSPTSGTPKALRLTRCTGSR